MDLNIYRKQIDEIDEQLIRLLADRFKVTQKIGEYKKIHKLSAIDTSREKIKFKQLVALSKSQKLNPKLITDIFRLVINEVVKNHNSIKNDCR